MKNLTTAIFGRLAGSALNTSIGGRMYKGRAPQGATWPYIVYFVVSDVPDNTFTDSIEDVTFQFSIFSNTSGTTEIEDIFTNLKTLYDDTTFTVTANTMYWMVREHAAIISIDDETEPGTGQYWMYTVDYNILMKKN